MELPKCNKKEILNELGYKLVSNWTMKEGREISILKTQWHKDSDYHFSYRGMKHRLYAKEMLSVAYRIVGGLVDVGVYLLDSGYYDNDGIVHEYMNEYVASLDEIQEELLSTLYLFDRTFEIKDESILPNFHNFNSAFTERNLWLDTDTILNSIIGLLEYSKEVNVHNMPNSKLARYYNLIDYLELKLAKVIVGLKNKDYTFYDLTITMQNKNEN
jgi:hypothetical protein